jgi:DNA-directed RNA polymerase subunit RPC12/RpoP
VTHRSKSHDPSRDWGWNFHGIVHVPVDTARDGEVKGTKLHEAEATAYDGSFSSPAASFPPTPGEGRKRSLAKDAFRTAHDMKKWDQRTDRCRVGHFMGKGDKACPQCGAQPQLTYKCGGCGKPVLEGDWKPHACGANPKPLYAASLIYLCRGCDRTVHEGDAACWHCGAKQHVRELLEEETPY